MLKEKNIGKNIYTINEGIEYGKSLRKETPRSSQSQWNAPANRRGPLNILIESNKGRLESLIPIRFERMSKSPFAFLRGAAAIMAYDLSYTPVSGIYAQCGGDCHIMNFGLFATPERNIIFDMNDFDETLPAPWEWDVKRLTASIIVAGRYKKFSEKINKKAVLIAVRAYRENMNKYTRMNTLDVWYRRINETTLQKIFISNKRYTNQFKKIGEKARHQTNRYIFPKLTDMKDGQLKIVDQPPLIYHLPEVDLIPDLTEKFFKKYRGTLPDDRKFLFDKYYLVDAAVKVVGVGSVGTKCYIALFMGKSKHDALFLQIKQARESVLEPYAGKSVYSNHAKRVVNGQKLMQAASDIFLGWTEGIKEKDYYIKQLRDMKYSVNIDNLTSSLFINYAMVCGLALAKSHAKAGASAMISGYLGTGEVFDYAIVEFASEYANQNEKDYKRFVEAVKEGEIAVQTGK